MFRDVCKSFSVGHLTGLLGPSRSPSFPCSLSSINQYPMAGLGKLTTDILASQLGAALPHRHKIWIAHSLLLQFMTKDGELHMHTAALKTGKTVAKPGKQTLSLCLAATDTGRMLTFKVCWFSGTVTHQGWVVLTLWRERESSRPVVETESRQAK